MKSGIYFRPETEELETITGENDTLPGGGWQLLTDDTEPGLVAARALLVERGLVDEQRATDVYWYVARRKQDKKNVSCRQAA